MQSLLWVKYEMFLIGSCVEPMVLFLISGTIWGGVGNIRRRGRNGGIGHLGHVLGGYIFPWPFPVFFFLCFLVPQIRCKALLLHILPSSWCSAQAHEAK
jgi:hypothetical protein